MIFDTTAEKIYAYVLTFNSHLTNIKCRQKNV